jgi:hypothetical protein
MCLKGFASRGVRPQMRVWMVLGIVVSTLVLAITRMQSNVMLAATREFESETSAVFGERYPTSCVHKAEPCILD